MSFVSPYFLFVEIKHSVINNQMVRYSDIITHTEAENSIRKVLGSYLKTEEGYAIYSNLRWGPTSRGFHFDLVVERNSVIVAVFEIKNNSRGVEIAKGSLLNYVMSKTPAKIFVIYNTAEKQYLLFEKDSINESSFTSIEDVVQRITSISKDNQTIKETGKCDTTNDLKFYECTEKILDPEFCREELGNSFADNTICRYSSLESLFCTLKYKTLRMNGLPGMNDKTEGLFAWNLLNRLDSMTNEEGRRRKRDINNAFIVSFSKENNIDQLDMWRLYGDDAKGVCCVYSVQKEKIKDRFFLHNIKYIEGNADADDIGDTHLDRLRNYHKQYNELTYLDLSPTIFFYKSKDFEKEEEVRLLVDNKKTSAYKSIQYKREWVLTNANNIPNPYIDVALDEIPLKLERIILGPNMNDIDTIQVQLEAMLEQQDIEATVEPSHISVYRNPNG